MTTKLTLTVEEEVIKAAKEYAQKNGKSVSELVENYLKTLAGKDKQPDEVSPRVKRLLGAVSLPNDFDYKNELGEALAKKYRK